MSTDTIHGCDAISTLAVLTTVDCMNILTALMARQARTPVQQEGRQEVANTLLKCHVQLLDIWTAWQ